MRVSADPMAASRLTVQVLAIMQQSPGARMISRSRPLSKSLGLCDCRSDVAGNGSRQSTERSMIMTKFATFALALGLSASTALAGGYVAPVVEVEPVVVDEKPASTNAGLVVPALLLLGVIAAVASDDDDH
ncbi:hypothetical protein Pden_4136 [Paracoccus denitrificans PD1222]|uniref:Ferrochelatase n=3 Tax=Paracoccus TaxID=265 RepID=A1B9K6_PARDP|nr:hypothetical protein Pden_4136 [Paracoccus denitrificans PD1222]